MSADQFDRVSALGVSVPEHLRPVAGRGNAAAGPSRLRGADASGSAGLPIARAVDPDEDFSPSSSSEDDDDASDDDAPSQKRVGKGKQPAGRPLKRPRTAAAAAGPPASGARTTRSETTAEKLNAMSLTPNRKNAGDPEPAGSDLSSLSELSEIESDIVASKGKGKAPASKRVRDERGGQADGPRNPMKRPKSGAADGDAHMTAGKLEQMLLSLEARQRANPGGIRGARTDIARQFERPGATSGRINTTATWLSEKSWQEAKRNFAGRLSALPDYPQHRASIQNLLRRLGLYGGQLPDPTAQTRSLYTAADLVSVLRSLITLRNRPASQRGSIFPALAERARIPERPIRRWITAEGSLKIPTEHLSRLPGYAAHREQLRDAFAQLGQRHVAADLPEPGDRSTTSRVTAETVSVALQRLAENPRTSIQAISRDVRINEQTLGDYVAPERGGLRTPAVLELLGRMPDYAQWRDSIAGSLTAMGRDGQAAQLPPTIRAQDFLDAFRTHRAQVVDAIGRMRRNATLSAHNAARDAGVPWGAFSIAVDAGPTIRDRASIESRLHNLQPHLQRALETIVGDLNRLAVGADSGDSPMIPVRVRGGLFAPDRLFIVERNPDESAPGSQVAQLYALNPELVRGPRSYEHHRSAQLLRWVSTVLRRQFASSGEVQSYFDREQQTLYVSSNAFAGNREMREFLAGSGLDDAMNLPDGERLTSREMRHWRKLQNALSRSDATGDGLVDEILRAIRQGRFQVPDGRFREGDRTVELHAERRIQEALRAQGRPIDLRLLAGTMRACAQCAAALGFDDQQPRGPFWISHGANAFLPTEQIVENNTQNRVGSYATRDQDGKITADHNTDSDSDADTDDESDPEKDQ
jgi:hypothetical protein